MTIAENFKTEAGSSQSTGANSITRSFYVYDVASFDAALTEINEAYPPSTDSVTTIYEIGTANAKYFGTKNWSRVDGVEDTWQFNLEYSTAASEDNTNTFITTQGDTRGTTKNVWRVAYGLDGWATPSGGWNAPDRSDIGGQNVDSGGTPTTIVTVDRRFETTVLVSYFPNLDLLSDLVGTRNGLCHDGGESGTILYLGFSWSYDEQSTMWSINHQFSVDKSTHHAEQVAKTDSNGDVLKRKVMNTGVRAVEGNVQYYIAAHVYWVQPFALKDWGASGIPRFCLDCC